MSGRISRALCALLVGLLVNPPVLAADSVEPIPQYAAYLSYKLSGALQALEQPAKPEELAPPYGNGSTASVTDFFPSNCHLSARVESVNSTGFTVRLEATVEGKSNTLTIVVPYDQHKLLDLLPHVQCDISVAAASSRTFRVIDALEASRLIKTERAVEVRTVHVASHGDAIFDNLTLDPAWDAAYFAGYASGKGTSRVILYTCTSDIRKARILAQQLAPFDLQVTLRIIDAPPFR